ncbi:MAG: helix-turn-helix domain-containing protein [Rhodospirillales bacterium]|nr:helix-turn-helix domain-containing protein [Rhodospirillales bacterium]
MRYEVTGKADFQITIGVLAQRTGCNIETIRFYEKIGVLPKARRTEGGRRIYGEDFVRRLTFIRRARELGFTLDEVRALLRLADARDVPCSEVKDMAIGHRADIQAKVADLRRMKKVLDTLIAQCQAGDQPGCPLIETLFGHIDPA